jgi:hypothetical protein
MNDDKSIVLLLLNIYIRQKDISAVRDQKQK